MEMILKIMGAALGVLVPYLFVVTVNKGIQRSHLDDASKARLQKTVVALVGGWTALVWTFSLAGIFSFHAGDVFPRFLLPLFIPVLFGLALLFRPEMRTILDHTPLSVLVGVQTFRFAGLAFIIIAHRGILPMPFVSGGYGDIATGALALSTAILLSRKKKVAKVFFTAFSAVGLIDLLNVAALLLNYYPIWYSAVPNSSPAADFSLIMIPAIAAPIALLLHFYALRSIYRTDVLSSRSPGFAQPTAG